MFRLLGPVELDISGQLINLGPAKQRSVLAVLLMNPGRAVPLETIVDLVWGDAPPRKVRTTLYSYITRVRRVLRNSLPEATLDRGVGGYVLNADPETIDLHRFRRIAVEARTMADRGDWRDAERRARSALGLWRGEPLAGLSGDWVTRERETLRRERGATLNILFEGALATGHHHEVLPDLSAAVAAEPLAESLIRQLMLALYRAGQCAEASAAYVAARRRMIDELGVEPGPQLRDLHQRILRRDRGLAADAPRVPEAGNPARATLERVTAEPATRVAQLPAPAADFVGRSAETARLRTLLTAGSAASCVVAGMPGAGKSATALHVAQQVRDAFPDGQLYACLRGSTRNPRPAGEALGMFLGALGVPAGDQPRQPEEQACLFRSLLDGRRTLIVLDDARDADQVSPLIPGSARCCVLITSQRHLTTLPGAHLIQLGPMADEDAISLLGTLAGLHHPPGDHRVIARSCDRLPLALRIAGGRLRYLSADAVPGFLARLADERSRLRELELDELSVRATFTRLYALLGEQPGVQRAFRLLGRFRTQSFSTSRAAGLLDMSEGEAAAVLEELVRSSLIVRSGQNFSRMPVLLSLFARQCPEPAPATHPLAGPRHRRRAVHVRRAGSTNRRAGTGRPPWRL